MPFQFRKEAIEEDLNSNFPSQGQGNPPLYYSLSEVVVPTYSINTVAEGSSLPENLQTALDFSVSEVNQIGSGTSTITSTPGFYRLIVLATSATGGEANIQLTDGLTVKNIVIFDWNQTSVLELQWEGVVFVNTGITLQVSGDANQSTFTTSRQIADLNGNLVNPLGFSFA